MTVQELWSRPELWGKWAVVRKSESEPFTTYLRVDWMWQADPVANVYRIVTDEDDRSYYEMVHADVEVEQNA